MQKQQKPFVVLGRSARLLQNWRRVGCGSARSLHERSRDRRAPGVPSGNNDRSAGKKPRKTVDFWPNCFLLQLKLHCVPWPTLGMKAGAFGTALFPLAARGRH